MPKILVCGDVGGNLPELYKRVAAINAKNGPFDCLFCVGEVRSCFGVCTRMSKPAFIDGLSPFSLPVLCEC